jgi:vancomycin resistance protein YoaR
MSSGALSAALAFPWRLAVTLSVVPLLLLASLAYTFRVVQENVAYPRVRVAGASISGLTRSEARVAVEQAAGARLLEPIVLRAGDQTWRRNLLSLGFGSDARTVEDALTEAWAVGHRLTWRDWLLDLSLLARDGAAFPPRYSLDRDRALVALQAILPTVEREPVDAEIVLVQAGDGYEVHLTPASTGIRVDPEATINLIEAAVRTGVPSTVDIATRVTNPTIGTDTLRAATAAASALVDDPIELVDPEDPRRRVVLDAPTAHAMLQLQRSEGGVVTSAKLDPVALRAWVADTARSFARAPTNPRVALDRESLVIQPGIAGRRLDVEATARAIEAKLAVNGHVIEMVVVPDYPWVPIEAVEEARAQVESAVREAMILIFPVGGATDERQVERATLLSWLELPDSEVIPRDTSQMSPANRPSLAWGVELKAFDDYVQRVVLPRMASTATEAQVAVIAKPDLGIGSSAPRGPTQTPSRAVSTAIALGTAISRPAVTPTGQATPTVVGAFSVRPTATTVGSVAPVTTPTSVAGGPFAFEAVVIPGRPGRTVDVEALRRAVESRLQENLTPLTGVLVVPPTATAGATARLNVGVGTGTPSGTISAVPTRSVTVTATRTRTALPTTTPTVTPTITSTVTPTVTPTLRSPVSGIAFGSDPQFGTPIAVTPSSTPISVSLLPTVTRGRTVIVTVVDQPAAGNTNELAAVARTANVLIGAPIVVEWSDREWRVEQNDLVDLVRFGPVGGTVDAYLGRDGLFALAERIGREASTIIDAPRDASGLVLAVDVPRTAAAIWAAANQLGIERRAEIAWVEDDPTPVPGVSSPMSGPPTATRTPVRNPGSQRDATSTTTPTPTPTP